MATTITASSKVSIGLLGGLFAVVIGASGWAWAQNHELSGIADSLRDLRVTTREAVTEIKLAVAKALEQSGTNTREVAVLKTVLDSQNARILRMEKELDDIRGK